MGATGATANQPKSDDKYAQKSVRGSSFRSDLLQNPYFKELCSWFVHIPVKKLVKNAPLEVILSYCSRVATE